MITWQQHLHRWSKCQRCSLGKQRSNICFARSEWVEKDHVPNLHLPCDIVFVGEAPGPSEDTLGLPFVGPAGRLLDQIIERSIPQEATYSLTNLVACFPREAKIRGDNEPERSEILECRPRLIEFINLAQPRLLVRVGVLAATYMQFDLSIPHIDIDHPAYILRMPLAQQGMAIQRCIVHLRNACLDMLQSPREKWKEWGTKSLKEIYESK